MDEIQFDDNSKKKKEEQNGHQPYLAKVQEEPSLYEQDQISKRPWLWGILLLFFVLSIIWKMLIGMPNNPQVMQAQLIKDIHETQQKHQQERQKSRAGNYNIR